MIEMLLFRILRFLTHLTLIITAPAMLVVGCFSFGVNELYVWYIMHTRSLFFAIGSLVCIALLNILTLPTFIRNLFRRGQENKNSPTQEPRSQCYPTPQTYDPGRSKGNENVLASALALALQRQVGQVAEPNGEKNKKDSEVNCDLYVHLLKQVHQLKNEDILTEEEYEGLKIILLEDFSNLLKTQTKKSVEVTGQ